MSHRTKLIMNIFNVVVLLCHKSFQGFQCVGVITASPAITQSKFWPINILLCLCFWYSFTRTLLSRLLAVFSVSLAFGMALGVLISRSTLSSLKWFFSLFQKDHQFFVCHSLWSLFCFETLNSFDLYEGQIRRNLIPRRYATLHQYFHYIKWTSVMCQPIQ